MTPNRAEKEHYSFKKSHCYNLEGWDGEGDGREVQEGGNICIPMADSCRCLAETNTIRQSTNPSIKR